MYDENTFITLTYNDDHLPDDRSVDMRDFQLFMKRLRKKHGANIRFFHCGEYGEKNGRPHYHACLFNFDFQDKKPWKIINDNMLYTSNDLSSLWTYGFSSIGEVTFQSSAYVARYILKKITGEPSQEHYQWIDPTTGEIHQRKPEYVTMSRRPGIGKTWYDQFRNDVYPSDEIIMNGSRMRPPKFYDRQLEALHEKEYRKTRAKRKTAAKKHADDQTPARLKVRETVQNARLNLLPRKLED